MPQPSQEVLCLVQCPQGPNGAAAHRFGRTTRYGAAPRHLVAPAWDGGETWHLAPILPRPALGPGTARRHCWTIRDAPETLDIGIALRNGHASSDNQRPMRGRRITGGLIPAATRRVGAGGTREDKMAEIVMAALPW